VCRGSAGVCRDVLGCGCVCSLMKLFVLVLEPGVSCRAPIVGQRDNGCQSPVLSPPDSNLG
jgi:hypothetical protein